MEEKCLSRCAAAYQYHQDGFNCAQSVVGAFQDLLGMDEKQAMAMAGGFGGGVGGSHAELCGAVSGGVLVLGLLTPHTDSADKEGKRRIWFEAVFGLTRCGELLKARPGVTERNSASACLGVTAHCDNMIVTAVELVEQMLAEERE